MAAQGVQQPEKVDPQLSQYLHGENILKGEAQPGPESTAEPPLVKQQLADSDQREAATDAWCS